MSMMFSQVRKQVKGRGLFGNTSLSCFIWELNKLNLNMEDIVLHKPTYKYNNKHLVGLFGHCNPAGPRKAPWTVEAQGVAYV